MVALTLPGLISMALVVLASDAAAQGRQRCTIATLTDPARDVVRCPGVSFEAESKARHKLIDGNRDGTPESAHVTDGAVLVDIEGAPRGGFQVLTPHATAAVRGTTYAVDVQQTQTSVFVVDGRVAVGDAQTRDRVVLGPGQGVDVIPGQRLEVKTWSQQRARRLLARFGR